MKRFNKLIPIVCLLIAIACTKEETKPSSSSNNKTNSTTTSATTTSVTDCQTDQSKRRGAKCKDGTESSATGQGACSGHGGVDYWLCK